MKTVLDKLSNEKAKTEVTRYAQWGLAISFVTLFVFWWLAGTALACGLRSYVLTYHKGNKRRKDLLKLRLMSGAAIVLSLISFVWSLAK